MGETKQSKACQYLYAVIKEADWIEEEYKQFAEKYKKTEETLIELYLCISDKVSLDVLELVELNEDVAEAFRECRRNHLEAEFLKKYSRDIRQIKYIATATEREVKQMSGTVKQIADNIPTFEEMFMQPVENTGNEDAKETKKSTKKTAKKTDDVIPKKEVVEELKPQVYESSSENTIKSVLPKQNPITAILKKRSPAKYIESLVKEGYSKEQIEFILECLEDGDSIREVKEFASPKIEVELMRKLRKMKKENK